MRERVPRSVRFNPDSWDALIQVCHDNREKPADVLNRLLRKHLQTYHPAVLLQMEGREQVNGNDDSV